jgi:hypothetical protein
VRSSPQLALRNEPGGDRPLEPAQRLPAAVDRRSLTLHAAINAVCTRPHQVRPPNLTVGCSQSSYILMAYRVVGSPDRMRRTQALRISVRTSSRTTAIGSLARSCAFSRQHTHTHTHTERERERDVPSPGNSRVRLKGAEHKTLPRIRIRLIAGND